MSPVRARPPWRRLAALAVLLAALLVLGGWLVLRDDDDPDELAAVRALPGVAAVSEHDDDVTVRLRPHTTPRQLAAVLDRAPEDADSTTLVLGRAALEVEDDDVADDELLAAFGALSAVRAAGGTLELERLGVDDRVEVDVRRPEQAAPLAREIVARLAPGAGRIAGVDRVEVSVEGAPEAETPPVVLRRLDGSDGHLEAAVLDAAIALPARRPRVSTNGDGGELRPRADGVSDAGAAWREAAAALDLPADERAAVRLYVDVVATVGEREGTRPVVSGPSDGRPDRALALLGALPGSAADAFVATDLRFAEAQVPGPGVARAVATAARSAGVRRLSVTWPDLATADASSPADERSVDSSAASLQDTPGVLLELLPGISRARRLGIDEVRWNANAGGDAGLARGDAALQVAPPSWIDSGEPLASSPSLLRRYARAIRAIGWPGTARLALPLGRGSCAGYPSAQGVARIRSTSDARARSAEPVGSCTDEDAVAAARRAWDATAG